jgi:hypothetical protein
MCEYVYLLQEREFVRSGEPVFKIGRTASMVNRLKGYPKQSCLILCIPTPDSRALEELVKYLFDSKYTHRSDIGREYFEGDRDAMVDDIIDLSRCSTLRRSSTHDGHDRPCDRVSSPYFRGDDHVLSTHHRLRALLRRGVVVPCDGS